MIGYDSCPAIASGTVMYPVNPILQFCDGGNAVWVTTMKGICFWSQRFARAPRFESVELVWSLIFAPRLVCPWIAGGHGQVPRNTLLHLAVLRHKKPSRCFGLGVQGFHPDET